MHPSDFPEKPFPPNLDLPGIDQLVAIVAQLRSPAGCPWDREQTHASLRASLLEEAYEVVEAIDNRDEANLREELGDLLLQSVFHAQLASEKGRFTFDQVAREISAKLVRRHPHVFAGDHCEDSEAVLARWEEIKLAEKGGSVASLLDGIPRGFPPQRDSPRPRPARRGRRGDTGCQVPLRAPRDDRSVSPSGRASPRCRRSASPSPRRCRPMLP